MYFKERSRMTPQKTLEFAEESKDKCLEAAARE